MAKKHKFFLHFLLSLILASNNIFLGLHNPLDTLYHLQPFMTLTLMPLAFYIEGRFSIFNTTCLQPLNF